ncbi:MAG: 1,4-dihydroxy-2-naphthoate octaprenyltransferase [Gammaproteobacteria bacterium]|nr:1,4-dihydroxy-2-naphthoate octaprenyltransferase [Gammaproteobacteria bacterium]
MPIKPWFLAVRPKTLSMAFVPVLSGSALALSQQGSLSLMPMLVALLAAVMIQIGTNLHNDAADYEHGVDTPDRLGPERAVAQGWLSSQQVKRAAILSFALAFLCGVYLVWVGGWLIMLLGLLALTAGYAYTGGPVPVANTPLGELFVVLFFGVIAVSGSFYLQTLSVTTDSILLGIAIGLPAAAALLVNNYRDYNSDKQAGRKTLVILIGQSPARYVYFLFLFLPLLITSSYWLTWLSLPMLLWLMYLIWSSPIDAGLNRLLALTAQYQIVYGMLLITSLLLLK